MFVLKDGEKIIKLYRRHHLVNFCQFLLIAVLLLAPFFFMFLLFSWGDIGLFLFFAPLAFGLFLLLRLIYFWYHNALVVTDQRVVRLEQHGALNKIVTELIYDNIHNVSYQIKGIFPTLFRYGRIRVQTANDSLDLVFDAVAAPAQVAELINSVREKLSAVKIQVEGRDTAISLIEKINRLSGDELIALRNVIDSRIRVLVAGIADREED